MPNGGARGLRSSALHMVHGSRVTQVTRIARKNAAGMVRSVRGPWRRGYTLADSLVALVLVVIAAVTVVGVVPYSFGQTQHDAIQAQANTAGQQFLDGIRYDYLNGVPIPSSTTAPIDYGQKYADSTTNNSSANFSLSSTCSALNGSTLTDDCTVTVQWTENGSSRQVLLETYVTELI